MDDILSFMFLLSSISSACFYQSEILKNKFPYFSHMLQLNSQNSDFYIRINRMITDIKLSIWLTMHSLYNTIIFLSYLPSYKDVLTNVYNINVIEATLT